MSTPEFTILIDGDCPLCRHEANLMRKLDKGRGNLELVDIAEPEFDAATYGTTFETVMGHIHGVLPSGELVTGMEVFRRAYAAVGWGWVLGWTRLPVITWFADRVYSFFARYRLAFTGRKDACDTGRCAVPGAPSSADSASPAA